MAEKNKPAPEEKKPSARKAAPRKRDISTEDTQPFLRGEPDPAATGGRTVEVVDASNKRVRDVTVHAEVFGVKANEHLMWEAVKQYRAGGRRGTHMTKNRALVSGTGKKPWRQKGTGRARVGEARNPLWRHGGTVFGPVPRDYSYSIPRKARLAALRSALSQRLSEGALKVVDRFPIESPRTKELQGLLRTLGVEGRTLLVDHRPSSALVLSGRNIPGLKVVDTTQVNIYDVLECATLLVSQEALGKLEERLTP